MRNSVKIFISFTIFLIILLLFFRSTPPRNTSVSPISVSSSQMESFSPKPVKEKQIIPEDQTQTPKGDLVTQPEQAFLKNEIAKAIARDQGIDVDDVVFKDNQIIIMFESPLRLDLTSNTLSSVYMLSLAAGVVAQTKLKKWIDTVVLIARIDEERALKISTKVNNILAIAEGHIPQNQIQQYILIEEYKER